MPELQIPKGKKFFPYSRWEEELPSLKERYRQADPFPHIALDHFLEPQTLDQALAEFPTVASGDWICYVHANERKFGKTDFSSFGPTLRTLIEELQSDRFVQWLSDLTGIQGLFPDESLEGGGLHQSGPGGFLNIHADFTAHPHHSDWQRRVNVLVYLNKDWQEAYGGYLELWDKKMRRCEEKIAPIFNRAVIFSTAPDSFHGHPDPLCPPEGIARKSIALYYFTKEARACVRSTEYHSRPQDRLGKKIGIVLDSYLVRIYDRIKRTLGIGDDFASRALKFLDRCKKTGLGKKKPAG